MEKMLKSSASRVPTGTGRHPDLQQQQHQEEQRLQMT